MRRLTLILSDLYLPVEASNADTFTSPLVLPALTALLRVAASSVVRPDWRCWLAAESGSQALAEMPVARVAGLAVVPGSDATTAWLATPVHLEARLDHVRLVDRGLLNLAEDERLTLCTQFARQFGPQYGLHATAGRDFVLTGIAASRALTMDPARLLDTDIAAALPRGDDAIELRKLGAEIEMWLHGLAPNDARERAGRPRISALWLWGGGAAAMPASEAEMPRRIAIHGSDSFLAGLAQWAKFQWRAAVPPEFSTLEDMDHHVVELTPMSGDSSRSMAGIEAAWFAPALAALERGALITLDIVANDMAFRITPRMLWRFWRPRRTWFENVARRPRRREA